MPGQVYDQWNPSPLKCDTTGTEVNKQYVLRGETRITRGKMHRLLKSYGIIHRHDATLDQMIQQAQIAGIPIEDVPPGPVRDRSHQIPQAQRAEASDPVMRAPEPKNVAKKGGGAPKYAKDGFPQQVPVIRRMLKERGIKTMPTLKRAEGVKLLKQYQATLGDGGSSG